LNRDSKTKPRFEDRSIVIMLVHAHTLTIHHASKQTDSSNFLKLFKDFLDFISISLNNVMDWDLLVKLAFVDSSVSANYKALIIDSHISTV
jgi:hypothetical protein